MNKFGKILTRPLFSANVTTWGITANLKKHINHGYECFPNGQQNNTRGKIRLYDSMSV